MRNGVIYDLKIDIGLKLTISMSFGDFIYFQGLYRKSARVIKTYKYQTCPKRIPTRNTKKKTLEDTRRSHVEDGVGTAVLVLSLGPRALMWLSTDFEDQSKLCLKVGL